MIRYLRFRVFMFVIVLIAGTSLSMFSQSKFSTALANQNIHSNNSQTPRAWNLYQDDSSMARRGMAAVFDSHRQVVVMFGGEDMGTVFDETWEFDGASWQQVSTPHTPPARFWHGMAYDTDRQVVVLFGGFDEQTYFNDTWEYDGSDWAQVTTLEMPQPLAGFGMAYDSCRQKTVFFSGDVSWGTWEYDGTNWEKISVSNSPEFRWLSAITFDSVRCRAILFGGCGPGVIGRNDTWEFDGANWVKVNTTNSPTPRWAHALAYDPILGKTILFGGYGPEYPTGNALGDTWEYDGSNWVETSPNNSPSAREQHIMAYEGNHQKTLLFGGFGNGDTWFYGNQYNIFLPLVIQ